MQTGRDANGIKALNRHILEQIVVGMPAAVLVADAVCPELPVVYVNPAYERLTGYALEDVVGRAWTLLSREADGDEQLLRLKAAVGRGEACRITIRESRKDGASLTSEISVTPLHNARGDLKYFLCSQQAVGAVEPAMETAATVPTIVEATGELPLLQRELGRARPKSAALDRIDAATGLMRFGHFQELLRRDLAISRREHRAVTLLAFEIVEFDVYRQTFGTKAADSCQRMIGAQIMRVLRRAGDLCARYDDTTLIASVLGQEPDEIRPLAEQIAENIRKLGLHNPRAKASRYITVRPIVIGCAPEEQTDPAPIIAQALADSRHDVRAHAVPA
jgi:PAS domain S-box-containing protein/diguanylate cyclase (GGDEF)-like protein